MCADPPHPPAASGEVKVIYSGRESHNPTGKSVTVFMQEDKRGIEKFKWIDLTVHAHNISHTYTHSLAYIEIYGTGVCECTCCLFGHTGSRQAEIIPSDSGEREITHTWQQPDKWAQLSASLLLITFRHAHAQAIRHTVHDNFGNLWNAYNKWNINVMSVALQ